MQNVHLRNGDQTSSTERAPQAQLLGHRGMKSTQKVGFWG